MRTSNIDQTLPFATFAMVALVVSTGCGDSGGTGGGGTTGDGTGGAGGQTWAEFCASDWCEVRAQRATDIGCDFDVGCQAACQAEEPCAEQFRGLAECAKTAEVDCFKPSPVDSSYVVLVAGQCAAEYNALFSCKEGPCDDFFDQPCAPITCPDQTVATMCLAETCQVDPSVVCQPRTCTTSEECPAINCDGSTSASCQNGSCVVTCT